MPRKSAIALLMVLWLGAFVAADDMDELIKTVIGKASTNTQRAQRLIEAADLIKENPKAQIAFCEKAVEYGLKTPSGHKHALTAIGMLEQIAPDRKAKWLALRTEAYRRSYRSSRGAERNAVGKRLLRLLLDAGDARLAGGKASEAVSLYREAMTVAAAIRSPDRPGILSRINKANKKLALTKKFEALQSAVKKTPTDVAARDRLIMFCLFDLDAPAEAARYLKDDADELLRTYVPMMAKPIEEVKPEVSLKLGKWYYGQASKVSIAGRFVALTRAMRYYERYLSEAGTNDLKNVKAKLEAKLALDRIVKQLSKLGGGNLPKGAVDILTFDRATISRKGETTYARDVSGSGNNAVLVGAKLVKGIAGQAVSFTGAGEYVDTRFANTPKPKTVVLWAKSNKANVSEMIFFGCYTNIKLDNRFYMGFTEGTGQLGLGLGNSKWNNETSFKVDTAWHHYTIVWTGSVMSIYVDARLQGTKKGKTIAGGEYYLGAAQAPGKLAAEHWNGLIDEFAIFDRPLTIAEIKKIYGLGRSGKSLKG